MQLCIATVLIKTIIFIFFQNFPLAENFSKKLGKSFNIFCIHDLKDDIFTDFNS